MRVKVRRISSLIFASVIIAVFSAACIDASAPEATVAPTLAVEATAEPVPTSTPAPTSTPVPTPTPEPTPVPEHLTSTLERHEQMVPQLLLEMRQLLYGLTIAEKRSIAPVWVDDYRVCDEETLKKLAGEANRCISAEEYEEVKSQRGKSKKNYVAETKVLAADWIRHVNILCKWTTDNASVASEGLQDVCNTQSPRYIDGKNLGDATTFNPHYRRIVQFFSLQEVARVW